MNGIWNSIKSINFCSSDSSLFDHIISFSKWATLLKANYYYWGFSVPNLYPLHLPCWKTAAKTDNSHLELLSQNDVPENFQILSALHVTGILVNSVFAREMFSNWLWGRENIFLMHSHNVSPVNVYTEVYMWATDRGLIIDIWENHCGVWYRAIDHIPEGSSMRNITDSVRPYWYSSFCCFQVCDYDHNACQGLFVYLHNSPRCQEYVICNGDYTPSYHPHADAWPA